MYKFDNIRGHHFCGHELHEDSIVVDLGACLGDFSRQVSTKYGCNVFAIEASPESFNKLYTSDRVRKFHYAIAETSGKIRFNLANNPEGCSIYASHRDCNGTCVEVEATSLSDFLKNHQINYIDLLKVDLEGAEIDLIQSMTPELSDRIAQITLEFHDFIPSLEIEDKVKAAKHKLRLMGFSEIVFKSPNKDVLFVNRRDRLISPLAIITYRLAYKIYNLLSKSTLLKKIIIRLANMIGVLR